MATDDSRIGVLLFNLGGPDDQRSVEPFLMNLFSDREIIELPLGGLTQPIFAWLIAKLRGPSVRRNYALIGGGSPQLGITRAQADALERRLNDVQGPNPGRAGDETGAAARGCSTSGAPLSPTRGAGLSSVDAPAELGTEKGASSTEKSASSTEKKWNRFRVFIAMRYWSPSTEDALGAIEAEGIRRIVTLTLFPHWSKATTGSSQNELDRALALPRWRAKGFVVSGVDRYAGDPLYLDAFADTVRTALEGFAEDVRDRVVILFSAHGLPQKFVDAGDPYVGQIEETRRGLLARLRVSNRQLLGYQSRTGPVTWIGPGTDEKIRELGREGVKELLVVPLSFVSDHIETLYEVDILFKNMAIEAGITDYRRPAALNAHPLFVEALARLVERHLEAAS